ncbi:MAG: hypothetical protein AAFP89_25580 [Bacteroidota bacterium]
MKTKNDSGLLRLRSERNSVGLPKIQEMTEGYNFKSYNSVHKVNRAKGIPNFEPDFEAFFLSEDERLTSFLSATVIGVDIWGLIVNSSVKRIVQELRLPEHKFYEVGLLHGSKRINNYYWLHIPELDLGYIDFSHSEFVLQDLVKDFKQPISIKSREEYISIKAKANKSLQGVMAKRCVLKQKVEFDLFSLETVGARFFISHAFNLELEKKQITGYKVTPSNILVQPE